MVNMWLVCRMGWGLVVLRGPIDPVPTYRIRLIIDAVIDRLPPTGRPADPPRRPARAGSATRRPARKLQHLAELSRVPRPLSHRRIFERGDDQPGWDLPCGTMSGPWKMNNR
jgi:hypothetical protein